MSRIRSLPTTYLTSMAELTTWNDNSTGSPVNYNTYPGTYDPTLTKTMTDEVSVGYFTKRKSGEFLPINPMTQSGVHSFEWTSGSTTWKTIHSPTQTSETHVTGSLGIQGMWDMAASRNNWVPYLFKGTHSPSLDSQDALVTEAIARARSDSFDAGTFSAELNKTISMIANLRTNVFRRANRIVSGEKAQIAERGLAAFSETWLEGRYGWRTLAYDMDDIRESIEKLNNSEWSQRTRAYASSSDETIYNWSGSNSLHYRPTSVISSNNRSRFDSVFNQVATTERRAGAIVEMIISNIASIDPLVTAWEVIPFSFIVDWFTNIGEAVKAYSPFASGDLLGLWYSERETVVSSMETIAVPWWLDPDNSVVEGTKSGSATLVYKNYSRSEVTPPTFDLSFRLNLDWQKLVDLGAIVALRYLGLLREISKITRV